MKKTYFVLACFIMAFIGVSLFCSVSSRKNMNGLLNDNVEALAEMEGISFGPMCSQTGTPGNYHMLYCGNCNGQIGCYDMDYVAFCPR
ncbi:NVEALA domain-containing protein [Candidatus Cryptobacteroides sp.]|uniref:NVEALA domain-containing protein n=1 Tax=Candidatus Cryptobacteroides sp. TaxID=2952915 RepID=UPI0034DEDBD7